MHSLHKPIYLQKIQDRVIKLTHTSDQLVRNGQFGGEQVQMQTFNLLEQCTNLVDICNDRERLYIISINFFRAAQSVSLTTFSLIYVIPTYPICLVNFP